VKIGRLRIAAHWIVLVLGWLAFTGWYTSWGGPLDADEIDAYVATLRARGEPGRELDILRTFLESDTGDDLVMVNVIEFDPTPEPVAGSPVEGDGRAVLEGYMAYMWPALLSRASHPIVGGQAAAGAVEQWGLEASAAWSMAGLMRYRSRRDLMEIVTDPAFAGAHVFKSAAMTKTLAFPIDPWFQLGDPRLVLALVLLVLGQGVDRLLGQRRSAEPA